MQSLSNRFTARIVLAGLAGASVPLAVVGGYLLARPQGVDWTLLSMLAMSTAVGALGTGIRLRREAAPVTRISHALRRFTENREWRPVPCNPDDEIGQLSTAAQRVVGTVTALERKCDDAARRDGLTGLLNRPAFLEAIADKPLASLALIDIDRLKEVNDLSGHAAGDAVLRGFAAAMAGALGPDDILARWSGKQFILWLDEADPGRAREIVEQMRGAFSSATVVDHHRPTFSAGLVSMSGDFDIDLTAAEELLHSAKTSGRNRVMTPMLAIADGAGALRDWVIPDEFALAQTGA